MSEHIIHLAGGCFWGLEKYMSLVGGVVRTRVGYANGTTEHPTYEEVCSGRTGHAETVEVVYDPDHVSLPMIVRLFFEAIDPTSLNRQGGDVGNQYRTGIYYSDPNDREVILKEHEILKSKLKKPSAIEISQLESFYPAEEYHQKYLDKHPGGYCHIGPDRMNKAAGAVVDPGLYSQKPLSELRADLSDMSYRVTMQNATEPPFKNDYWNNEEEGIYVDITTGEPLFSSRDQFESGCGWPSFSRPIDPNVITSKEDKSHFMTRIETRSRVGDTHLGHVFDDGPRQTGGLRYCINSAALRFVKREDMEKSGYGYLLPLIFGPLTPEN